ncbi:MULTISPECIES: hypothetical protein [Anoxybacillus]|uniref:Phage protein n=2 Tax=Anoxybacillus flavithermus TaxID=33934 RepID=A0A178TQ19_9BACL|nr:MULTISPECIES: hypothetical protein [Anoxybacillus]MBE2905389.1 hypothetical protein [Anoxybacillus flavithermus]MBE2912703.1 hypothetical protein [Anoxybacillus flavithermus]MBE2919283.1 hypothetical protein [Anoxybacillus flavithermus]MBE2921298.1 hypothetical protein [Anoxybacillus flavithermus]MBE2926694.1 hypothetical protein [Anoxybacillus flavithermus]
MRTIQQELKKWMKVKKVRQHQNKRKKARKKKRDKERLTERDIKELMGVGRPVYRRGKGGAFRQR